MRAPALLLAALLAALAATALASDRPRLKMQPIPLVGSAAAAANGEGPGAPPRLIVAGAMACRAASWHRMIMLAAAGGPAQAPQLLVSCAERYSGYFTLNRTYDAHM